MPSSSKPVRVRSDSDGSLSLASLDLLACSVLLLRADAVIAHANVAAEALFGISRRNLKGRKLYGFFASDAYLRTSVEEALQDRFAQKTLPLTLSYPGREPVEVTATLVVLHGQPWPLLVELREEAQIRRIAQDVESIEQADANRELLRNLAHEVKNPLGGLRGAAQLLQTELDDPVLTEYTQVIIAEADRLRSLVDRLLAPHQMQRHETLLNIHEVCERVAALVLAEFGSAVRLIRDYDISVPDLLADREQLIQVLLNIMRNAAQISNDRPPGDPVEITVRTRVARQVTLHKRRYPLALTVSVIDNGPGIPESIRARIFHPLVTGRAGGTGLGLSLAQSLVVQHGGILTCDSQPGRTEFRLTLPLRRAKIDEKPS